MVHWTGILNLISLCTATAMVAFLWLCAGWHWYGAVLVWPVTYLAIPVFFGLCQGVVIRSDMKRGLERAKRGEPID